MRRINIDDAKNRLSELLDALAAGETIEIVRRGKPAARLVPVPEEDLRFETPRAAAQWLRENRTKLRGESVRALIDQGRRRFSS